MSTVSITTPSTDDPAFPASVPARESDAITGLGAQAGLERLPQRDLSPQELRDLAAAVAARRELWDGGLDFSGGERHYVSLYRDAHVDVWVLCWNPANDTGWHDHDISSGAVAVVEGSLVEHNLTIGRPPVSTEVGAGRVFSFGPDHIHRLTGQAPGTVSIHAYSPPLWRMGQYVIDDGGVLHRVSVSYADELRPLDDVPETPDTRAVPAAIPA